MHINLHIRIYNEYFEYNKGNRYLFILLFNKKNIKIYKKEEKSDVK